MKEAGICGVIRRKRQPTPLDTHAASYPENLLDRDFKAESANLKWVTDITYIPTGQGWLYMSVVMDLYSRRIVGWCFQSKLDASIATKALSMAVTQRKVTPGLLVHSDRGSQFTSDAFQKQLADHQFVQSMSRKGDCWDNAAMESFFGTLKQELIHRVEYKTRRSAVRDIFQWIESWYNRHRRHSYLGYESPDNYEKASLQPKPITIAA
jgi:transposase InsO family protein